MSRAVRIHDFGDADVLRIEDVTVGQPGEGEVRLKIHAIGLNRTEITLRSGRSPVKPALPTGLGFEAAGIIDAVGPDVTGFAAGDRVALVPAYGAAQYALYGEVALAPAASLVAIPEHIGFVEAAATWAAFGTAWSGLVAAGQLAHGQHVLIPAASSSVGLAAIQISRYLGAYPIAVTRRADKVSALTQHGAETVIVREEQDLLAAVQRVTNGRGIDLVFDPVGGPGFAQLVQATANGGTLVLYGALSGAPATVPPFDVFARDITIRGISLPAHARNDVQLSAMKQFVEQGMASGALYPVIARTFSFDDIAHAHRAVEAGEHVGKIVVTL
ncbi:zinc-dependent alcohol dehydrogenase family protein [Paraburkholderia acidipaludis]|uniref:zinc-dependent alcohol dehydrogenase family protein n=1 Tax=Paraburkholderia acidipaludis TaxID=660537 RepID=UPI000483B1F6|nr:zinc-dependent alcohol dehydrogenase family protein [Paraburkholderia acidipaludis]